VFVTLRLEDGEELPFFIDTGTIITLLDKSLEPKLGKCLGPITVHHFGNTWKFSRYAAPVLYLGNTRLMTGSEIYTSDLKSLSDLAGRPIMGVLGMDCLKHYCIQLDFQAGRMRFLNPDQVNSPQLGTAFPIRFFKDAPYIDHVSLAGGKTSISLVDTGFTDDGMVGKALAKEHHLATTPLRESVWNGETYTNLTILPAHGDNLLGKHANILGLRFLARHLVTLDFPARTLYLKQTDIGPLVDEDLVGAVKFLHDLNEQGRLPGCSQGDRGTSHRPERSVNSFTFHIVKSGDSSTYNYIVARAAGSAHWYLQRAWRTDQAGRTIDNYQLP